MWNASQLIYSKVVYITNKFSIFVVLLIIKIDMNLTTLIKQYFSLSNEGVTIDVFDEKNIYDVYQRVVGILTQ